MTEKDVRKKYKHSKYAVIQCRVLTALLYLEGDPAAGEDEAVLFRQQDTLLLLPLASSRRLSYQRADGVSHITERRGDIYGGRDSHK